METPGTITFVADVGEEGLGDLRGMKNLFNDTLKGQIDKFISVDGTGLGIMQMSAWAATAIASTFKGPGGHSFGAFGMANPIQAMGRAIAKIDAFEVPRSRRPRSTWGAWAAARRSTRSRSRRGWKWTCARPTRPRSKAVDAKFKAAVQEAVEEENRRWNEPRPGDRAAELVGISPGRTDVAGSARSCRRRWPFRARCGFEEALREGSTDSNVPMNLGIPAITISGGGSGTGAHSLNETFDTKDSWLGTQRALLLAVALAR